MKPASHDLAAFYRAAQKQEEPRRADRRAVRAGLVGAGAFTIAANAGATASTLAALIPGAAKVLTVTHIVGYVAVGAALGGTAAVIGFTGSRAPCPSAAVSSVDVRVAHSVARSKPDRATPPQPESVTEPEPASEAARASESKSATDPPPPARHLVATAQPLASNTPSLTEESRSLAEVQAALSAHDANRALQLLATQDREFATGALGQERSAARVFALCKAGLHSEAESARAAFLFKYPQSPFAKRVGAACEK